MFADTRISLFMCCYGSPKSFTMSFESSDGVSPNLLVALSGDENFSKFLNFLINLSTLSYLE